MSRKQRKLSKVSKPLSSSAEIKASSTAPKWTTLIPMIISALTLTVAALTSNYNCNSIKNNKREQLLISRPVIDFTIRNTTKIVKDTFVEIEFFFKNIGATEARNVNIELVFINLDDLQFIKDTAVYESIQPNSSVYCSTNVPIMPFIMNGDKCLYLYMKQVYVDTVANRLDSLVFYQRIWQDPRSNDFTRCVASSSVKQTLETILQKRYL